MLEESLLIYGNICYNRTTVNEIFDEIAKKLSEKIDENNSNNQVNINPSETQNDNGCAC